jgi:hypothetical protein
MKTAILLFFLFFYGCKSDKVESKESLMLKSLSSLSGKSLDHYKAVVFVPSEGCGGCINSAENFLLHEYLEKNGQGILFVVTGHSSIKSARIRLGQIILSSKDVYLDLKHGFDKPPFMNEYPKMWVLNKNEIISETEMNPNSSEKAYKILNSIASSGN